MCFVLEISSRTVFMVHGTLLLKTTKKKGRKKKDNFNDTLVSVLPVFVGNENHTYVVNI